MKNQSRTIRNRTDGQKLKANIFYIPYVYSTSEKLGIKKAQDDPKVHLSNPEED